MAIFPKDAALRGFTDGTATIRFTVGRDGVEDIEVVRTNDVAFGEAAKVVVGTFDCRAERPLIFEVPFFFKAERVPASPNRE